MGLCRGRTVPHAMHAMQAGGGGAAGIGTSRERRIPYLLLSMLQTKHLFSRAKSLAT